MPEHELRDLIEDVRSGRLPRRGFVARMVALGLGAPLALQLLTHAGIAQAQAANAHLPTRRGGGGTLRLLWWQAPTLLNPHFAQGQKDLDAGRIFYEPLAMFDDEGGLIPVLAAEIPSLANGGVAADGRSVTWKLKRGVSWHDGRPFSADDCVFTWEYARHPETAAATVGNFRDLVVEKIDSHTIRIVFPQPTAYWFRVFLTGSGLVLPRHVFGDFIGSRSRDAPANLKPVGTGPYRFVEFRPGDLLLAELNPSYHEANRPFFDKLELKGGGDAVSAARAVLQTGEYDFAGTLSVEDEVLKKLETGGKGRAIIQPGGAIEFLTLNSADPWTELDGERANPRSRHPLFADPAVRQALALLIDRQAIQQFIYGRTAVATGNYLNRPERFSSRNTRMAFNPDQANALLDGAGWKRGRDGVRVKDGKRLKLLLQTSTTPLRQKTQAVLKQAWQRAGFEVELKAVTAAVFFSSDPGNPDTANRFLADIQLLATGQGVVDPGNAMRRFVSAEIASKANRWEGRNAGRWRNEAYNQAYAAAQTELDPVKRAALFIRMNDLLVNEQAVIPLVMRADVSAAANKLHAPHSVFDSELGQLKDWYRQA